MLICTCLGGWNVEDVHPYNVACTCILHVVEEQKFEMDKPLQSFKSHSQVNIPERDNIAFWDLEKRRLRTCCERGILALTYGSRA